MSAILAPSRPIVVCGMPRTGTTLLGQLIKTTGWERLVMFPEFSPEQVPALFDLLDQTRKMFTWQRWREFDQENIDARIVELFRHIIGSGRDPEPGGDDIGQPRFGFKEPRAEIHHRRFADSLGRFRPLYVYTFRDPVDAYRSFIDISASPPGPREWGRWLEESAAAAAALAATGDLFPVHLERWSTDAELRMQMVADLFAFLDLAPGDTTDHFARRWPDINRREPRDAVPPAVEELLGRKRSLGRYRERTESLPLP